MLNIHILLGFSPASLSGFTLTSLSICLLCKNQILYHLIGLRNLFEGALFSIKLRLSLLHVRESLFMLFSF